DSQYVVKTSKPQFTAVAIDSRTSRVLPIPGGPDTVITALSPPSDWASNLAIAAIWDSRPTRRESSRPHRRSATIDSNWRAGTNSNEPLIRTDWSSPNTTEPSTSRDEDSLSITPPDGATDSIRCAIPTC